MKILFKGVVICFALILELVVLQIASDMFYHGHGPIADTRYRQKERLAAYFDSREHPSPESKAKYQEELRLMHGHEDWKVYVALGCFITFNGVGIYYYCHHGHSKTTA